MKIFFCEIVTNLTITLMIITVEIILLSQTATDCKFLFLQMCIDPADYL